MTHGNAPNRPTLHPTALASRVTFCILLIALVASILSACSLQAGGDLLAFIRGGNLYVAEPDGSDLRQVASGNVVGFAWSPDHHQIVFRTVRKPLPSGGTNDTAWTQDAIGDIYITSVSGGTPLQLTQSSTLFGRSDAWWNANGNRLLYRESVLPGGAPFYIVSQSDQPVGIARKAVQEITGIPVLSADGSHVAGLDDTGDLREGPVGQAGAIVASGALTTLPGANRPAPVLRQPHTDALLYEVASKSGVELVLCESNGQKRTLMTVMQLFDVAFSPDGSHLLLLTQQGFEYWSAQPASEPTWRAVETDQTALPWWSPNGKSLLVEDADGIHMIDTQTGRQQTLLVSQEVLGQGSGASRWHPIAGSPWSPSGDAFAFTAQGGGLWQSRPLPGKANVNNVYVAHVGASGLPTLIASGSVSVPLWSYLDPSTVFLATS